jgi:hypothetical protein
VSGDHDETLDHVNSVSLVRTTIGNIKEMPAANAWAFRARRQGWRQRIASDASSARQFSTIVPGEDLAGGVPSDVRQDGHVTPSRDVDVRREGEHIDHYRYVCGRKVVMPDNARPAPTGGYTLVEWRHVGFGCLTVGDDQRREGRASGPPRRLIHHRVSPPLRSDLERERRLPPQRQPQTIGPPE